MQYNLTLLSCECKPAFTHLCQLAGVGGWGRQESDMGVQLEVGLAFILAVEYCSLSITPRVLLTDVEQQLSQFAYLDPHAKPCIYPINV